MSSNWYEAISDPRLLPGPYVPTIFVWRLYLTCSHVKLWGPFRDANAQKYVGDHAACEVCPVVGKAKIVQFQLVVKVEVVDLSECSPTWIQAGLEL